MKLFRQSAYVAGLGLKTHLDDKMVTFYRK